MNGLQNPFLRGMLASQAAGQQQQMGNLQAIGLLSQLQDRAETRPLQRALLEAQVSQAQQDAELLQGFLRSRGMVGGQPSGQQPPAFGAGGVSLPGGGQGNMQTGQVVSPQAIPQSGGAPGMLPPHIQFALLHPRLRALGQAEAEAFKPTDKQRDALALGMQPGTPAYNAFVGTQFTQSGAWRVGPNGQLQLDPNYAAGRGAITAAEELERARLDPMMTQVDAQGRPIPQTRLQFAQGVGAVPPPQAIPQAPAGYTPQEQEAIRLVQSGQATSARPTASGAEIVRPAGAGPQGMGPTPAQRVYSDRVAGQSAERDVEQHNTVSSAAENLNKLDMVINHLAKSDAITGMGADLLLNVERAKQFVSEEAKRGKRISDTELLDTFLGSDVFPMIKALGIGAKGLDTPAEREFLRKVMTGTIDLNKTTLVRMAQIRRDIATRAIERWNDRIGRGELDRYFEASGMTKAPIEIPAAPDISGAITDAGREQMPPNGLPQGVTVRRVR